MKVRVTTRDTLLQLLAIAMLILSGIACKGEEPAQAPGKETVVTDPNTGEQVHN